MPTITQITPEQKVSGQGKSYTVFHVRMDDNSAHIISQFDMPKNIGPGTFVLRVDEVAKGKFKNKVLVLGNPPQMGYQQPQQQAAYTAPTPVAQPAPVARSVGYDDTSRQASIRVQSARKDAVSVMEHMVSVGVVKLPEKKTKDAYAIYMASLEQLVRDLFKMEERIAKNPTDDTVAFASDGAIARVKEEYADQAEADNA